MAHVLDQKLRQSLVNMKDRLVKVKFSGVVYAVSCTDRDEECIGESGNLNGASNSTFTTLRKEMLNPVLPRRGGLVATVFDC